MFVLGDHRNGSADSRCHLKDATEVPGMNEFVPAPASPAPELPEIIRKDPSC
ncbi:hypothetical protein [Tessaracoccus massiliensis]|uniref:hypothetical protein n=1 Tax=Tessaracoccus massiliensis TaxID=1522311 RepID=UPI0015D65735|nr:hypothetical protein [Tessaracoccus massiliensis]